MNTIYFKKNISEQIQQTTLFNKRNICNKSSLLIKTSVFSVSSSNPNFNMFFNDQIQLKKNTTKNKK